MVKLTYIKQLSAEFGAIMDGLKPQEAAILDYVAKRDKAGYEIPKSPLTNYTVGGENIVTVLDQKSEIKEVLGIKSNMPFCQLEKKGLISMGSERKGRRGTVQFDYHYVNIPNHVAMALGSPTWFFSKEDEVATSEYVFGK